MRPFNKTAATLVRPHPFSTLCTTPLGKMTLCPKKQNFQEDRQKIIIMLQSIQIPCHKALVTFSKIAQNYLKYILVNKK